MIFEWLKKNKGTPLFKFAVMLLILFLLRIGIVIYDIAAGDTDETDKSNSKSVVSELFKKDENGEDEPLFDIHIGWSNIILLAACGIALVIIEKKKDKGSEEQPTVYINKNNEDEE